MKNYNKNAVALNPPMGWNSYDYYNVGVNEEQVKKNAEYMAQNLKKYARIFVWTNIPVKSLIQCVFLLAQGGRALSSLQTMFILLA